MKRSQAMFEVLLSVGFVFALGGILFILGTKETRMTKEEQMKRYGMEIPPEYKGFVLGREVPWTLEHFQAALAVAKKHGYSDKIIKVAKDDKIH